MAGRYPQRVRIVSVNVGRPATLEFDGRSVRSAIVKRPVAGRVMVRHTNLDGDAQADLRVHGGADKAVYVYPAQHYAHWAGELGRELSPLGYFGENRAEPNPRKQAAPDCRCSAPRPGTARQGARAVSRSGAARAVSIIPS